MSQPTPKQPPEPAQWLFETSDATFAVDVVERSKETPVVVDFWAAWCGPCQQLAPLLEQAIAPHGGRIVLVKAELDRVPNVAAALQVSSIPAVFALRDGHIVDQFVGLIGRKQLDDWLARFLPSEAEQLVRQAHALESDDAAAAEEKFREALRLDPQSSAAKAGLGSLLLARGELSEARRLVDELQQRGYLEPVAERLAAELSLRESGAQASSVEDCRAALETAEDRPLAELHLAQALAAAGDYAAALEQYLNLLTANKSRFGETARQAMVDIFQVLGADSELARNYRRRLSTALY